MSNNNLKWLKLSCEPSKFLILFVINNGLQSYFKVGIWHDTTKIDDLALTCAIWDVTSAYAIKYFNDIRLMGIIETNWKFEL